MERLKAGSTATARKGYLITRKIMIPPPDSRANQTGHQYFAKKLFPPDCWDPPDGPPYFAKKCSPRCQLGPTNNIFAHKEVPPYYAQKKNTPPASWDPPWWEADLGAY